ncbi:hypothetical protein [Marinobacter sp.]|uniref:hypothetical protein n=1 Tax=Marinobacter sp. TaxID=50741 RepID=UPI003562BDCB
MHLRNIYWFLAALLIAENSLAHTNHLPHPWRAEAVVEGRNENYDEERFVDLYSFRHSQRRPRVTETGLRGTGGSVGSSRLYFDSRFRQDFGFNDNRQAFMLDIQRSEDFDGTYQRQLVGFRHQMTDRLQVWLQGDVFADKSEIDVYASARYALPHGGWVHGSWIQPDAWFNDKSDTDDRILDEPHSYFIQWHQPWRDNRHRTTISATLNPESEFDSRQQALKAVSRNFRGAITQELFLGAWHYQVEYAGEYTARTYRLDEADASTSFRRQHHQLTVEAMWTEHKNQPSIGLSYIYLNEKGYFGRAMDTHGDVQRREPITFASVATRLGPRSTLRPAVYLGHPDVSQRFTSEDERDLNSNSLRAKLTLPLEITLSRQEPAVLTIAPTFKLHEVAFGGGNVQLHWPL